MLHRRNWLKGMLGVVPAGRCGANHGRNFADRGPEASPPTTLVCPIPGAAARTFCGKPGSPAKAGRRPWCGTTRFSQYERQHVRRRNPPAGFYDGRVVNPIEQVERSWVVYSIESQQRGNSLDETGPQRYPEGSPSPQEFLCLGNECDRRRAAVCPFRRPGDLLSGHVGQAAVDQAVAAGRDPLWLWHASSPALDGGRLYIVSDNEDESYILALDKLSGKENLENQPARRRRPGRHPTSGTTSSAPKSSRPGGKRSAPTTSTASLFGN